MKDKLIKSLANEEKYFVIFVLVLCVYALICVTIFSVCVNYWPQVSGLFATFSLAGAALLAFLGRLVHNYCCNKVFNHDSEDTI